MEKPLLIIDPGHGGKDVGGGTNKTFKEKNMNLKISLYQLNRFKELNVPVVITRKSDVYLSPKTRTTMVKDSGAKYCISNHINAYTEKARGVETIYSIYSDGKLAKKIQKAIVDAGMASRRVFSKKSSYYKGKDYYYMHRDTGTVETIIIEYGFATNTTDTNLLINHWKDYAEAVVKAFCEYVGHSYSKPQIENTSPNNDLPKIIEKANVVLEDSNLNAFITSDKRTVVEVREIANLLHLNVRWDSSTNTVYLTK